MLFDATLRRDLARGFGATLVVLLTIVLTMLLVRTLSLAASDRIEAGDVLLVLGYTTLGYSPIIIGVSMFAAIVVTLGRMYRDSEMVVWFASGLPLARFVRPVLRTFWPVLLVVAALLVFGWPWVNRNSAELRDRYAQRSDLSRVAPGMFQSTPDGRRVFFVERDPADELGARNVFVLSRKDGTETVLSAHAGRVESRADERVLRLERGQRSDHDAKTGETTLARFDDYEVVVQPGRLARARAAPPRTMGTAELIRNPTPPAQGELVWRFGLFATSVNLALLGVGLAHVNLRRPNNWNLVFALLAGIVYFNLVNLTQTWVSGARVGAWSAFAALHGAAFGFALALMWWRDHAAVFAPWRRARPAGAGA
jgi:lipopolysaccharide export system permease protein